MFPITKKRYEGSADPSIQQLAAGYLICPTRRKHSAWCKHMLERKTKMVSHATLYLNIKEENIGA